MSDLETVRDNLDSHDVNSIGNAVRVLLDIAIENNVPKPDPEPVITRATFAPQTIQENFGSDPRTLVTVTEGGTPVTEAKPVVDTILDELPDTGGIN